MIVLHELSRQSVKSYSILAKTHTMSTTEQLHLTVAQADVIGLHELLN